MGGKLKGSVPCGRDEAALIVADLITRLYDSETDPVVCGSYRRGHDRLGDLDFVILSDRFNEVDFVRCTLSALGLPIRNELAYLTKSGKVRKMTNCLAVVYPGGPVEYIWSGEYDLDGVQVDLYWVPYWCAGAFRMFLTGSFQFNAWQRVVAKGLGYSLNQYGLWKGLPGTPDNKHKRHLIASETEEEICHALGMYVPMPNERDGNFGDWKKFLGWNAKSPSGF